PATRTFPSGLKASESTYDSCPRRVRAILPVFTSQRRTVQSSLFVATVLPSGEKAAFDTHFDGAAWVPFCFAVATPQIVMDLPAADARSFPSGEKASPPPDLLAFRLARSLCFGTSHSWMPPSSVPTARALPSGEKATDSTAKLRSSRRSSAFSVRSTTTFP